MLIHLYPHWKRTALVLRLAWRLKMLGFSAKRLVEPLVFLITKRLDG